MEAKQITMTTHEFFEKDKFAMNAGVKLVEVRKDYCKVQLEVKKQHLNAGGRTQGGALFTLADVAVAICSNLKGKLSFSMNANISFLRSSGEGDILTAEAYEKYLGNTTGYYDVEIKNQDDMLIASFHSNIFRMNTVISFTPESK